MHPSLFRTHPSNCVGVGTLNVALLTRACLATVRQLFLVTYFVVGNSQVQQNTGPTQGLCNASLAIKNCALDPKVAPTGREGWPAGLISDISQPIYGQTEEYSLFADHLAYLIHQIFRDASMKESHIFESSSPGECYFPLLYYTCASAYHECREDANTTIRVERQVFPPPAAGGVGNSGAAQPSIEVVLEPLKVARYPCVSFCNDPQVRQCKVRSSLARSRELHFFVTCRSAAVSRRTDSSSSGVDS